MEAAVVVMVLAAILSEHDTLQPAILFDEGIVDSDLLLVLGHELDAHQLVDSQQATSAIHVALEVPPPATVPSPKRALPVHDREPDPRDALIAVRREIWGRRDQGRASRTFVHTRSRPRVRATPCFDGRKRCEQRPHAAAYPA